MAEDSKRSGKTQRGGEARRKLASGTEADGGDNGTRETEGSQAGDAAPRSAGSNVLTPPTAGSPSEGEAENGGESAVSRPPAGERPRREGREPPPKLTEDQINSPRRQTLVLLTVVSLTTILLWVAAKAACNMRTQVTRPRKVTVEQIVRSPKHAAIELQQRWAKADFEGAKELAAPDVDAQLTKEAEACDTACRTKRQAASDEIFSTAYVIERDDDLSRVWVRTIGMPEGERMYVLEVKRPAPGQLYQVVARRRARADEKATRTVPAATTTAPAVTESDAAVSGTESAGSAEPPESTENPAVGTATPASGSEDAKDRASGTSTPPTAAP